MNKKPTLEEQALIVFKMLIENCEERLKEQGFKSITDRDIDILLSYPALPEYYTGNNKRNAQRYRVRAWKFRIGIYKKREEYVRTKQIEYTSRLINGGTLTKEENKEYRALCDILAGEH